VGEVSLAASRLLQAEPEPARRWRRAELLVPCCFLVAAVGLTWQIWADPAARVPANSAQFHADLYLNIWFMRYVAVAVAHGHLPALTTTALNWPTGINLMWNTSLLLPGVVLTPVTLLAGPAVSLAILLTLGFAGSASTMYLVLRRWGASIGAGVVGGALYGFSPALMVAAEDHYHLQFAVLPPLIIDAGLRLATGRSRRPLLTGASLGLLVTAQIFIAEELLVDTALAGLLMLIVLAIRWPASYRRRTDIPPATPIRQPRRSVESAAGVVLAVAVAAAISWHALRIQFHGPLNETGSPWKPQRSGVRPGDFVTAPAALLLHGKFPLYLAASHQQPMEVFAYLGVPLLVAVLVATIVFWADLRVRAAGVTFLLLEWLGLGTHKFTVAGWRIPLPWHLFLHVPVLSQAMPNRFPILADGAAAAVLAFSIDRARQSLPAPRAWRLPAVAALTAAVLVPVLPAPVPTAPILPPPSGWRTVITALHLRPWAHVLVLPIDPLRAGRANAMEWQATTDVQISLIDGYCITRGPGGVAVQCGAADTLTYPQHAILSRTFALGWGDSSALPISKPMLAVSLRAWRPAALVAVNGPHDELGRALTAALGSPTARHGSVLGWEATQIRDLVRAYANCAHLAPYPWSPCSHLPSRSSEATR
jgi:hypothetical protein